MYRSSSLACFTVSLPFREAKIEHLIFRSKEGFILINLFNLEKLRVSYFENKRNYKLFFDWKKILILTIFFDAWLNSCVQVSHAEKRAPVSDWWLH